MQVLYPRCAGLDIHKDNVVARVRCVSLPVHDEVRSFATTTSALREMSDWLASHQCTHVAMEATGIYWKPVWHVLQERFTLILARRKTRRSREPTPPTQRLSSVRSRGRLSAPPRRAP